MITIQALILILGCICLLLQAIGASLPKIQLGWLGLFLISLTFIVR